MAEIVSAHSLPQVKNSELKRCFAFILDVTRINYHGGQTI